MGKIKELLVELEDEQLTTLVKKELDGGTAPQAILEECQAGLTEIGNLFSEGKMFVSDLMMAGSVFKDLSGLIMPYLSASGPKESLGKVVLGTVKEDIHDLGKNIVASLLSASGFEVIDLGVDVGADEFVKAVKEHDSKVLALSCLLVSCYDSIKATVAALNGAGLSDKVKVLIGGGPVDEHVVVYSGADAFGASAQAAVEYCKEVYAK
ncbi:MAG: cobalamin-dependent protein [Treponema sp.]|jgi:methylmalonyl-CoA mutase cobalamin-binding domain/chain|nr:cobalamin-dependent protein [Treponema sp.]